MRVTQFTKRAIARRKEMRDMRAAGYEEIEVDWKLHRGAKYDHRISFFDAKVSCDGQHVWIKVETEKRTNKSEEADNG